MKHQTITNILKTAGFESSKTVWQNGKRVVTQGYSVRQFGKEVGVDCCFCLSQMSAILETLTNAGFVASEKFPGGGMIQVSE